METRIYKLIWATAALLFLVGVSLNAQTSLDRFVGRGYADEAISATAKTTLIFNLYVGERIDNIVVVTDTAFTAGDTLILQDSFSKTIATIVPATGGTTVSTLTYFGSPRSDTPIYIKKNKATTAGYISLGFKIKGIR